MTDGYICWFCYKVPITSEARSRDSLSVVLLDDENNGCPRRGDRYAFKETTTKILQSCDSVSSLVGD